MKRDRAALRRVREAGRVRAYVKRVREISEDQKRKVDATIECCCNDFHNHYLTIKTK